MLDERCPECGFAARDVDPTLLADLVRSNVAAWPPRLARDDVANRPTDDPTDDVWSTLEYAWHVRELFSLFDERLRLRLTADDPGFADWDQDDPAVVAGTAPRTGHSRRAVLASGGACARRWEQVGDVDWGQPVGAAMAPRSPSSRSPATSSTTRCTTSTT